MQQTHWIMLLLGVFVLWRLSKRIRKLVGRQQSKLWRHWVAVVCIPLLLGLLALGARRSPDALLALAAGVAIGVGLAIWGVKRSQFEVTAEGYFYIPDAKIGIALSLLLVARVGYRFLTLATLTGPEAAQSMQSFGRSPLTLIIVGTMFAYYAAYAAGLLRWRLSATGVVIENA